jgi:hypothetical protein
MDEPTRTEDEWRQVQSELAALRDALRPFAEAYRRAMRAADGDDPSSWEPPQASMEAFERADELVPAKG